MNKLITIFAIESSCDETAISIVQAKLNTENYPIEIQVLSHEVESQIEIHAPFGGVVPEVAARDHLAKIYDLALLAIKNAGIKTSDISLVACTYGPGLIGALMVGVLFARGFAYSQSIPLAAINHVDAHLSPVLLLENFSAKSDLKKWIKVPEINFPALALTVSGGHCHLSLVKSPTEKIILGKSLDDACGEAFDKTAKLLGMPYPGGPEIEKSAFEFENLNINSTIEFPSKPANRENRYHFTYSGLKTSVMELIRKETGIKKGKITGKDLPLIKKQEIAFAFQEAALKQLFDRVKNAIEDYPEINCVLIAGGVAQNKKFRKIFSNFSREIRFATPSLCSDNATMIALQALINNNDNGFEKQAFSKYEK